MKFLADDCVVFRRIDDSDYRTILQEDLDTLNRWTEKWLVKFNVSKCKVMNVTLKRKIVSPLYHLSGVHLEEVSKYKYLGVIITHNLTWSEHCSAKVKTANKIMGLVRRTLGDCNYQTKSVAYTTLVRPHLEYCSPVWSPYTKKDIHLLERVQKRAAHICLGNWEDSYKHLRGVLKWQTLELRRTYLSLLQMFCIVRGNDAIPFDAFFELAACQST